MNRRERLDRIENLTREILDEVKEMREMPRRRTRITRVRDQEPVPEPEPIPEPTRPEPEPEPTRPGDIPVSIAGVLADGRHFDLTFTEAKNFPGVFITEVVDGLCAMAMNSFGGWAVGVLNPFARNGSVELDRLEVGLGSTRTVENDVTILPGWGRWTSADIHEIPDPGTATQAGRINAAKTLNRFQFAIHDGLRVTNTKDANEPGGAGIYMENEWAVGCPDGIEVSHYLALGWANRNAIFRFDRASWVRGRIAPHSFEADPSYKGIDTTKTFPPQGYEFDKPSGDRQGAMNQLDYSHIVRMVHPVRAIASQGSKFGLILGLCLAAEARAALAIENTNDSLMQPWAMYYWSVFGWMNSRSRGTGSGLGGRHFNGALRALNGYISAASKERSLDKVEFVDPYVVSLQICADAALYHFNWNQGLFYRLGYATDSGFEPSPQWLHKVRDEQWPHRIPEGETPAVWKGFEHALTFGGLRDSNQVLSAIVGPQPEFQRMLERMADRMAENNPTLGVWENPAWGTPDTATWTNYVLGHDRADIISMTETYPADWTGDHPANCFPGDLHR